MNALALTRRKTQIALLAEACRQRRQARVARPPDGSHRGGPLGGHVEFVARAVHVRPCQPGGTVMLGCRFCSRDGSTADDRQLAQLGRSLVRPERTRQEGG
jgi:hypothetical protein